MATTAKDTKVQDIGFEQKSPYKVDTTGSNDINQGDNLYLDTSAHQVKSVGSDGNVATYVGVAADTSYRNLYGTKQYPDSGTIQVYQAGIFSFTSVSGDTLTDGNKVYYSTDAQTATNTDPGSGHAFGIVKLRPGVTSLAGGSSVTVDVQIVPRYPYGTGL